MIGMLFVLFSVTGCDRQEDQSASAITKRTGKKIVIDIRYPFASTCFPGSERIENGAIWFINTLIHSRLFVPDNTDGLEPDLAIAWDASPDYTNWTVSIRRDALWHNGEPVTVGDVVYSLESLMNEQSYGTFDIPIHTLIQAIDVLEDYTLSIVLTRSDPDFLFKIWRCIIVPKPLKNTSECRESPIGSGPFKFDYKKGDQEVGLVADDAYYRGRPDIDQVIFHYEPNSKVSWERLLTGEADIAHEIDASDFERIKQYEDQFYFDRKNMEYSILLFNTTRPPFDDPRVRLALAHAIDKESMIDRFLKGNAVLACGPLGCNPSFHNPELKPVPYDPEKALELLQTAGWLRNEPKGILEKNERNFELTLSFIQELALDRKVAECLAIYLEDIGIRVHIEAVPLFELVRRYAYNDEFQAVLTEFTPAADGLFENTQRIWSPVEGKKAAAGCFEDSQVTELFQRAVQEQDASKKTQIFYQIDTRLASLQPGVFLFQRMRLNVMSRRITLPSAFHLNDRGLLQLWRASIVEPPRGTSHPPAQ